jgi:hypothetical protein
MLERLIHEIHRRSIGGWTRPSGRQAHEPAPVVYSLHVCNQDDACALFMKALILQYAGACDSVVEER